MNLEHQLQVAREAVLKATDVMFNISGYRNPGWYFPIDYKKEDGTPSTPLDKAIETEIRNTLLSEFPEYGFDGEEFGSVNREANYKWVCDPIDGTWSLINGEKTVAISLALCYNDKAVLAIVYNPLTDELFCGAEGIPTTLDESVLPVFKAEGFTTTLGYSVLPVFNKEDPEKAVYNFHISASRKDDVMRLYELWEHKKIAKLISRGGSIAYNLAQVAEGSHSVYIASSTKKSSLWDIAAGVYLVESVGGKITQMNEGKILIASTNSIIHKRTLGLLAEIGFGG